MNQKRLLSLALVVAIAAMMVTAVPAAAELNADPTVSGDSDIDDDSTFAITHYDDGNTTILEVTTDNSDTIDAAEAEIEVDNRDHTVYTADETSDDYSIETDVDTSNDGSADSDVHTWTINNSEFGDAPVEAGGTVDLNFTVEVTDGAGDSGNVTGTATLENGEDRANYVLDQAAIDGDSVAILSATEEEEDQRIPEWVPAIGSAPDTDYDAEASSVPTDGHNTTHVVHIADADASERFGSKASDGVLTGTLRAASPAVRSLDFAVPDPSPDSGDRTFAMAATLDDTAYPVFYESADSSVVDTGNDTYAVYDPDANALEYHLGDEDFSNSSTVDVQAASTDPEDVVGMDAFASTMTSELSRTEFVEAFGVRAWAGAGLGSLFIGLPIFVRRRELEVAS